MHTQISDDFNAHRKVITLLIFFAINLVCIDVGRADITLPKLFSDHMVLQRNSAVKIWGTADPNQKLVVTFAKQTSPTTADKAGNWSAIINTADAGGPFRLEIAAAGGEPKVIFSDVMVGEVWLCSGQSNMEWPMKKCLNSQTEIEQAKEYTNLRLFTVAHQTSPLPLASFTKVETWRVCGADSVSDFSAVGYFFGREISRNLGGIPIGLIDSSWGGTPAEAWISRASMDEVESLQPLLSHWDANKSPSDQSCPGNLFNGMIAPLGGFKFQGVIWYQGEANNGRGQQYATLLPTLIGDWRKHFSNLTMPFYFVQLAPFRYKDHPPSALAEVWEAQLKALIAVPQTGMVVTTDIAEPKNIHPKNKQEVGRRLALIALANLYGQDATLEKQVDTFSGPIFQSQTIDKNRIRLQFDHIGEGLQNRNSDQPLSHFSICGTDRKFMPATATIIGSEIEVSSPDVENPVAVRFGWSDTAEPNLVNSAGLPASPFRTDDFPLESAGRSF